MESSPRVPREECVWLRSRFPDKEKLWICSVSSTALHQGRAGCSPSAWRWYQGRPSENLIASSFPRRAPEPCLVLPPSVTPTKLCCDKLGHLPLLFLPSEPIWGSSGDGAGEQMCCSAETAGGAQRTSLEVCATRARSVDVLLPQESPNTLPSVREERFLMQLAN